MKRLTEKRDTPLVMSMWPGDSRSLRIYNRLAAIEDILGDEYDLDCLVPENAPTLTSPNEWVSVETPPTTQGWYHIAVLDLKTGKYTVEQDLYSIELAKAHGFEPGFCKANRRKERERIDYWCRFPAPPDRRPPEGKEGDADRG